MKDKKINRWTILIASTIINFSMSTTYIWSIYAGPLMELFGWTAAATALTYTICNSVGPVPMIIGGKVLNRFGPRKVVTCAAILFGGGMFLSGFCGSLMWMYMTYGVCVGVGMAIIYICTISNTLKFFEDRRGFASGMLTAGSGISSVVAAPVAQTLIDHYDVLTALKAIGGVSFLIIMICASLLRPAPKKHLENDANNGSVIEEKGSLQMLGTPRFYLLVLIYAMGAMGGIMVISQASNMAQEMVKASAQIAAMGVSIIAIGNTAGRLVWGTISDKIGRYNVLPILFSAMAILLFAFSKTSKGQIGLFFTILVFIGFCFGGFISIFPAITAENFGNQNSGSNYGIMFSGYALASMAGPQIAVACKDAGAEPYSAGLIIATFICIGGVLLCMVLRSVMRRLLNKQLSPACFYEKGEDYGKSSCKHR